MKVGDLVVVHPHAQNSYIVVGVRGHGECDRRSAAALRAGRGAMAGRRRFDRAHAWRAHATRNRAVWAREAAAFEHRVENPSL